MDSKSQLFFVVESTDIHLFLPSRLLIDSSPYCCPNIHSACITWAAEPCVCIRCHAGSDAETHRLYVSLLDCVGAPRHSSVYNYVRGQTENTKVIWGEKKEISALIFLQTSLSSRGWSVPLVGATSQILSFSVETGLQSTLRRRRRKSVFAVPVGNVGGDVATGWSPSP